MFWKRKPDPVLAELEHVCTQLKALTELTATLLAETQQARTRAERTDGRTERIEYALEALLNFLAEHGAPDVPRYPMTRDDMPALQAWRLANGRRQ